MRPNPLRDKGAELALGAWLSIPSPVTAEAIGQIGFDYVCIDLQHGLSDFSDALPMLQALTASEATPVVRVQENQFAHIGKALDAGAMAVIVPMVNTAEQCQAAVSAGRYAPQGSRSYGPTRVGLVEGPDYFQRANAEVEIIPMIETTEALTNIDDILSIEGVNRIYVGPADLSISLGVPPKDNDPALLDALDEIVKACGRHDVVPGMHTNTSLAQDRIARGFRMLTITTDLLAMRAKSVEELDSVRSAQT